VALAYIAGYSRFNGSSTFDQDGGANPATSFTTAGRQLRLPGQQHRLVQVQELQP
jgi:iron complex outermembrane receptor protein